MSKMREVQYAITSKIERAILDLFWLLLYEQGAKVRYHHEHSTSNLQGG